MACALVFAFGAGCPNPLLTTVKHAAEQYAPNLVFMFGNLEIPAEGSLDLGAIYVGQTRNYVCTIANKGANDLSLTGASRVLPTGSSAYTVLSQPAATIAAGGKADFTLQCQPTEAGTAQCLLTIASNDTHHALTRITVTVSAIAVPLSKLAVFRGSTEVPAGGYADFGSVAPGSISLILKNRSADPVALTASPAVQLSGAEADHFSVSAQPAQTSIAAGASTSFTVAYIPPDASSRTATVTIANDVAGENPLEFSVGVAPQIEVSREPTAIPYGSELDFGQVRVGQYSDATITLKNGGSVDLHLTGASPVTLGAGDVSLQAGPGQTTISPGGTTTFTLHFAPQAVGSRSSSVTVSSDSHDHAAFAFTAKGTGTGPDIDISKGGVSAPSGITLGLDPTNVGYSSDTVFTISNLGNASLELTGGTPYVAISGPDAAMFSIVGTPPSQFVSAGQSTIFTLRFSPSAIGTKSAALTVANDDVDEGTYTIPLSVQATEFSGTRTVNSGYVGAYNAISLSAQNVYIAHMFSTYDRIRLSRSLNGGANWSTVEVDPGDGPAGANKTAYGPVGVAQNGAAVYVCYSFLDKTSTYKYYLQLATSADYGQNFTITTIDTSILSVGGAASMTAVGSTLYVAYEAAGTLRFAKSTDGGSTWPTKLTVDAPSGVSVGAYAHVAVSGSDVYIVHYDSTNQDLKLSHSTDGGANWSTALVDSTSNSGKYCAIAASGSAVYLVYQRPTDSTLRFAASANKGSTWSFSVIDNGGVNGYPWPSVAVSGSTIHVGYYSDWGSYSYLHGALAYAVSTDGGATWTGPNVLDWDDWGNPAGWVGMFTAIAAEGSNVCLGYAFKYIPPGTSTSSSLRFKKSIDGGATWP